MRSQRTLLSSSAAVILGATAVLVPAPARAQEIKAGFSTSTISFSPEGGSPELPNVEGRTGFVVGVSFLIATSKPGGYQIEVLLHQKGAQNLLRRDDRLRLTYLEIPVLLHIDLVQRGRRAIFLVGGPAPAFNVHGSYEDDGVTEDVTRDIEDFDIGLVAGGGVEVRYLTVDARYTWDCGAHSTTANSKARSRTGRSPSWWDSGSDLDLGQGCGFPAGPARVCRVSHRSHAA